MYEIEILPKKGFKDVHGEYVGDEVSQLGFKNAGKTEYSSLYKIDGNLSSAEIKMIASELLTDKITETFKIKKDTAKEDSKNASVIEVWYKKGVTDTVAESVVKAVGDLGIDKNITVKTGHKYYFYGKLSREALNKIATKLLANTLIQEYKIK